ncbi:TPA: TolC family protein [Citrobacter sedlakii]|nr:transporter [Citrobacter sp. 50677481]HCQ7753458.1 TolC family protein [Citrobacter sedlakii]
MVLSATVHSLNVDVMNKNKITLIAALLTLSVSAYSQGINSTNEGASGFWGAFNNYQPDGGKAVAAPDNDGLVSTPATRRIGNQHNGMNDNAWWSMIHDAVMYHPSIRSEIATLDAAGFNIDVAAAGYLPTLSAGVTSGRQQDEASGHIATVGLSQMLYDFGKTGSTVDEATAKYIEQKSGVLEQIDDIVRKTALTLNEAHRYRQLLDIAEQHVLAVNDVWQLTQLRAEAGASSSIDPIQADARVKEAQAGAHNAAIKLQQQEEQLAFLLGYRQPAQAIPSPAEVFTRALPTDVDASLNPTLLKAQAGLAVAQAGLRNAKAQNYPTVSLEMNSNRYLGDISHYQSHDHYNNVYVSVSGKLYQGGALQAQQNASASALAAAKTNIEKVRLSIADEQRGYLTRIDGLQRNIEILSGRLETIIRTRELYKMQYLSLGTRNVLDLLNAEQEISRSQQDLINARHDLWSAAIGYLASSGLARRYFGLENSSLGGFTIEAAQSERK